MGAFKFKTMSNKERLDLLNNSFEQLLSHSNAIKNCSQQTDDLLSRFQQIKDRLLNETADENNTNDIADDFKEIHESHIQNTEYIEELHKYEEEALIFNQRIDEICGKRLIEPIWFQHLNKKCLNEAILFELYRNGQFKASECFIKEAKIREPTKEKQKFIALHQILSAMDRFEIDPALKWIDQNETKQNEEKQKQNESNFNFSSSHWNILRFLLHRDRFLHVCAVGSEQEMHSYMKTKLEKLKKASHKNKDCLQIISNLHYEAAQIAYYCTEWKLLYFIKMFSQIPLCQIPIHLTQELIEKYRKILKNEESEQSNDSLPKKKKRK